MIVKVEKSTAFGRISAPPSKSMAHRYLICGALSEGESRISGIAFSQDIFLHSLALKLWELRLKLRVIL